MELLKNLPWAGQLMDQLLNDIISDDIDNCKGSYWTGSCDRPGVCHTVLAFDPAIYQTSQSLQQALINNLEKFWKVTIIRWDQCKNTISEDTSNDIIDQDIKEQFSNYKLVYISIILELLN